MDGAAPGCDRHSAVTSCHKEMLTMAASVFLDNRRHDRRLTARVFCAECGRPRRMADDDLEEIFSESDFCQCVGGRC